MGDNLYVCVLVICDIRRHVLGIQTLIAWKHSQQNDVWIRNLYSLWGGFPLPSSLVNFVCICQYVVFLGWAALSDICSYNVMYTVCAIIMWINWILLLCCYLPTDIGLYCKSRYSVPFLTSRTAEADTELAWNTELTSVCQYDYIVTSTHKCTNQVKYRQKKVFNPFSCSVLFEKPLR